MVSLEKRGLLDKGDYYVVGVDIEQYESQNPRRYLKGLLRDEIEDVAKKAFQSYLGVVGSPPVGFEDFTVKVNKYMQLPPFNFPNPVSRLGGMKRVPAEGAYLYDAVHVYARALNECLLHEEDPYKGRVIFKYITERTYFSAMGYMVYMDENGDAEGNYTLIARKPVPGVSGEYGLYPVGVFQLHENRSAVPVLQFLSQIDWVGGSAPSDEPSCGFYGEKCVMWKLAMGVTGGLVIVLLIVILVAYKNWAYEQELDSLIWKIDYKDIQINEYTPSTSIGRICRTLHPLIRTSQVSLSSTAEADFRYTSIYTTVGLYKGRMLAIKRLKKKSVDITRKMKKELKFMRDLRHDNLNPFIGACVDPPNICIVTEYCAKGSLKDILENEDVKLDNMFIASLIGDIVRGMIYLHDSQLRSHGNLKSSNCLVDSRWVVKISDFGLHELKFGADSGDDDSTDFEKQCAKVVRVEVPAEGAYLYDAVHVYARALNECLLHEEDPYKGRVIFKYITERTYFSAMGYMVYMDENGDAEGNYTLIARKPVPGVSGEYGLYPVGVFQLHENRSAVPVLQFLSQIDWVGGSAPSDEPSCGFYGEKCVMWKLAMGVTGGLVIVLLIVILVAYKNWAYEQELDSLIWKIDYKDIQINEYTPSTSIGRICRTLHPLIRTSQVSLSSTAEADFRYTSIYTTVGLYKGRMLAIKRLKKKSVDITRKMKKELKFMRDLRHDNLNPFIGACVDPPNICIVTEYCAKGSLKDILENEDVKLDNMFIASLIGDIVRGMIYLHDSQLRSHGNLKSSNCLVDSRWVVKISDFGLHELKFGADSGDDDSTDFEKQCA
ncbi:guanylate cyclase 32E, partial [Trichonephila inaurata madagascariensis]